jgi:hypothetical protein
MFILFSTGLNPLINNQPPNRSEEVIVRQMENVVIDDSIMPFYKMDAKPRGLLYILLYIELVSNLKLDRF